MSLIARYLIGNIVRTTLFTLLALLSLFAFFDVLGELSALGRHHYDWKTMLTVVALYIPGHVYQLLPLAVLIGSLAALTLLAASSEYAVIRTSGVSARYISLILLMVGTGFAVVTFLMGEFVAPKAEQEAERLYLQATRSVVAQDFRSGLWVKDDNHFINVKTMLPDNTLLNVRIYQYDQDYRLTAIQEANRGLYQGEDKWLLQEVRTTYFGSDSTRIEHQAERIWQSVLRPEILDVLLVVPEKMSAMNLFSYIEHLKNNKQKTSRYEIALWGKLFYPLACLSMAIIAVGFTPANQRQVSLGYRLFIGIVIGLSFHFLNRLIGHLGLLYQWKPILITLMPTVLFLTGGIALLFYRERYSV